MGKDSSAHPHTPPDIDALSRWSRVSFRHPLHICLQHTHSDPLFSIQDMQADNPWWQRVFFYMHIYRTSQRTQRRETRVATYIVIHSNIVWLSAGLSFSPYWWGTISLMDRKSPSNADQMLWVTVQQSERKTHNEWHGAPSHSETFSISQSISRLLINIPDKARLMLRRIKNSDFLYVCDT